MGRVARHCLVDRVVDNFPDQVVEAPSVGRSDIHARSSPHRIEALEDLDALGVVVAGGLCERAWNRGLGGLAR